MDEGANDSRLSSELFNTNMQSTSPKHDLPATVLYRGISSKYDDYYK